jgi:AcrR family transcriptional regulator
MRRRTTVLSKRAAPSSNAGGSEGYSGGYSGAPPSRRRGRPPVISDERLLDVARDVFLARGIRATTAEVAERAQISEGTIFHRFKSKDALFRAAMRFEPQEIPRLIESLTPRAGSRDLRQTLVELATRLVQFGRIALPVMMMSWSNPSGEYSLEKLLNKQVCFDGPLRALTAFFEGEMATGRIRQQSAEVLARVLLGTVRDYCMLELFLGERSGMPPDVFVEHLVDLVLRAAVPEPL